MKDFILSTNKITNRFGRKFQILTEGINLDRFNKNPIMLFNHDRNNVIGTWKNVRKDGDKLLALPNFDDDESSSTIKNKVDKGTLKTASVGIEILKFEEEEDKFVITESNLLETSIVSIPQNDEAEMVNNLVLMSSGEPIELDEFIKNNNNKMEKEVKIDNVNEAPETEVTETVEVEVKAEVETEDLNAAKVELELKLENSLTEIEVLKSSIDEKSKEIEERDNKITELELSIKSYEDEKFNALLNNAIKDGKITEESKEKFTDLSYDKVESILEALPSKNASLSEDLVKLQKKSDKVVKTYDWYLKNDVKGLRKMAKEQPELYKRLEESSKK